MYEPQATRDRLSWGSFDAQRVRQAAYAVITRGQDDPATQVLGTAVALVALCNALDVDVRELLTTAERRRDDLDGAFVSIFDAIQAYATNEIRRARI